MLIDYYPNEDKEAVNKEIVKELIRFFSTYGLNNMKYEIVEGLPQKTTRGKHKRIVMEK